MKNPIYPNTLCELAIFFVSLMMKKKKHAQKQEKCARNQELNHIFAAKFINK